MLAYDVSEWVHQPVFHPPYVIQHLLPVGGSLLLYGKAGAMKSYLVQHMAFCIATGTEWLGFETTQARCLLVNFEISESSYHYRLARMSEVFTVEPQMLYQSSPSIFFLDEGRNFDVFTEMVDRIQPTVVILDCFSGCFGGDENSSAAMGLFIRNLSDLKGDVRSIVIVHHSNKNLMAGAGIDRARGHTKLVGWVDSVVQLVSQPDGKQLQFGKVRHAPYQIHSMNIDFQDNTWSRR